MLPTQHGESAKTARMCLRGTPCCRCSTAGATTDLWTLIDRCLVKICDTEGLPERKINKDTRLGMCATAVSWNYWLLFMDQAGPQTLSLQAQPAARPGMGHCE